MKKTLTALTACALFATPAFAKTITLDYAPEGADPYTVVYDDVAMMAKLGDYETAWTFDKDAKTICGVLPSGDELCVTFDDVVQEVGFETNFTGTDGSKGTVKVVSITE